MKEMISKVHIKDTVDLLAVTAGTGYWIAALAVDVRGEQGL